MAMKYFLAGSPTMFTSTGDTWLNGFQTFVNAEFHNAPDAYIIQEETVIGSGSYAPVEVRINRAINTQTGQKLGDDFKFLMFKDLSHATSIGYKYYFDDNYWLVINSEIIKNFAAACTVRRCNNVLRWVGTDGTIYSEPACIEYELSRPRDTSGAVNPVLPAGYVTVYAQMNNRTVKIKGNQRFLFGSVTNRICFKVFGDGVRSFLNQKTNDDESGQVLALIMGGNYVNEEVDNIPLGIADYYVNRGIINSGSTTGSYVVFSPNENYVLEGATTNFAVNYYSGSTIQTGSFVFTVSGSNVPAINYTFSVVDGNNFIVKNNLQYLYEPLQISCVGSSGSKMMNLNLRGAW